VRERRPGDAALDLHLDFVRELALEAATDEVQVEVEGGITRPAFSHSPGTELLYGVAERACAALGEPLFARSERGGSDASFAAALGVPTLDGLGPVCHDSCSTRERVDVPSVVGRGAMFGAVASGARVVL
jgi:glutamate carboxypeptidase